MRGEVLIQQSEGPAQSEREEHRTGRAALLEASRRGHAHEAPVGEEEVARRGTGESSGYRADQFRVAGGQLLQDGLAVEPAESADAVKLEHLGRRVGGDVGKEFGV